MKISSKRAQSAALAALILSLVFFLIIFILGGWSRSFAVKTIAWQILASSLAWLLLVIQFHLRSLAQQEKLDMAQLAKANTTTIFQSEGADEQLFASAARRLATFEKWFVPGFAALLAIYEIGLGFYLYKRLDPKADIILNQPLIAAGFMAAIAFLCFLLSRYTVGMSIEPEWRPLRSGGSYLLASALICFAAAIGLALAQFKILVIIKYMVWVVPVLLFVLGCESLFNFIMDIYRPRLRGQYSRAAFESRLLGLISEPGGIWYTTASALDYQFGFRVSNTWFFKLLEKAVAPLAIFSAVIIYLMSCFVVISPEEEAIVERFGKPLAGQQTLGPGMHVKLPWPIDIAYSYPTKRAQQINVGYVPDTDANGITKRQPLLWDTEHYKEEFNLLTATQSATFQEGVVPVSLIRATVPVQYRVKSLYDFLYSHKDSEKILSDICYREVVQFVAGATIETEGDNGTVSNASLLGAGRAQAAEHLKKRIQARADQNKLGVEIIFLGLQGFHPPPKVAGDYEAVIGSVQKKQALVLGAMADRNRSLTRLAGSVEKADELYQVSNRYQDKQQGGVDEKVLDAKLGSAKGDIFAELRQAQSYSYEKATLAKAEGDRFVGQLKAFRAAKKIYKNEQLLSMLEESLEPIRKYVVASDPCDREVLTIDLQEKLNPNLYDITGLEDKK